MSTVKEITPQELYQKFLSGEHPNLVDVRNPTKFGEWNIFTSNNLPYSKIMALEDEKDFPFKNGGGPVITVCTRGNDSKILAGKLQDIGIEAISLKGGIREWNNVMNIVKMPSSSDAEIYQFQRIAKGCLSYVVVNKDEAYIIDPAYNVEPYLQFLKEHNLTLTKIFETHLHADHVAGGRFLAEKLGAKLYLPEHDPFQFDFTAVKNNDSFDLGQEKIKAIYTPGHTKGSTSYKIGDVLLVGDTIFADGIGRPDLADKAPEFAKYLYNTINNVILQDSTDYLIGPAHHGAIGLDHLKSPIDIKKSEISKYDQLKYDESTFIEYAVNSANKTKKPDSYATIAKINAGVLDLKEFDAMDLETGPNRCALG